MHFSLKNNEHLLYIAVDGLFAFLSNGLVIHVVDYDVFLSKQEENGRATAERVGK